MQAGPGQGQGVSGSPDYLREERLAVKAWAQTEEENGHSIGRADLFRQFRILTEHKKRVLLEQKTRLAETGEELPDSEQEALDFVYARLNAWLTNRGREKAALKLLKQTGHRERLTNWRTSLSAQQETVHAQGLAFLRLSALAGCQRL